MDRRRLHRLARRRIGTAGSQCGDWSLRLADRRTSPSNGAELVGIYRLGLGRERPGEPSSLEPPLPASPPTGAREPKPDPLPSVSEMRSFVEDYERAPRQPISTGRNERPSTPPTLPPARTVRAANTPTWLVTRNSSGRRFPPYT